MQNAHRAEQASVPDPSTSVTKDCKDDTFAGNSTLRELWPVAEEYAAPTEATQESLDDLTRQRPKTTPVVVRRLIHAHLEVPLSPGHRAEERSFWSQSSK